MGAEALARYRLGWYLLLAALYVAVAYGAYGYDDEIFNIVAIEKLGLGIVPWVQTVDAHPPGSYLVDWLLFRLTGDWTAVRIVISLFAAGAIVWLVEFTRRTRGPLEAALVFLMVGLNPAILMWCTGLRWYALVVPLACLALAPPRTSGWAGWIWLFALLLAMAFIGYASFFIAPALFLIHWMRDPAPFRDKAIKVAVLGAVCALIYGYQLHVFLTVHMRDAAAQANSLVRSLQNLAIAEFGNQGLFPVTIPAAISALGVAGLFVLGLVEMVRARRVPISFIAYAFVCLAMLATGIAGKLRNLVLLEPFKGVALAEIAATARGRWAVRLCLAAVLIGNVWGIWNVATHTGTTKNNWNSPVGDVLAEIRKTAAGCQGGVLLLAHEQVLTNALEHEGYRVMSPYGTTPMAREGYRPPAGAENHLGCLIALETFGGAIPDERIKAMYGELDATAAGGRTVQRFKRDPQFRIKRRLDSRYPEYAVEMVVLRDARPAGGFEAWRPRPSPVGVPGDMYHGAP